MAITVIYSDLGDVDCASIPLLWKDVPDVNVMRLANDSDYSKEDIREAIRNEDDTLIMCGHGTPRGLLGYVCDYRPEKSWDYEYNPRAVRRASTAGSGRTMSMSEMYARLKRDPNLAGALGPMVDKKPAAWRRTSMRTESLRYGATRPHLQKRTTSTGSGPLCSSPTAERPACADTPVSRRRQSLPRPTSSGAMPTRS